MLPKILDEQLRKQEELNATLEAQLFIERENLTLKQEQQKLASLRVSQNIENKQATERNKMLEVQKNIQEKFWIEYWKGWFELRNQVLSLIKL